MKKTNNNSHASTLIKLATPMIISQGAMALMIFTDRYFMAQISPLHMSASLGGGVTSYFTLSLFIGLIAYSNAMVAQYYGAKAFDKCAKVVTASFALILACLPLLAIISYFMPQLFIGMNHPHEQIALETTYFYTLQAGAVFTLIKIAFASFFVGIGKTKTVMVADTLAVLINIPLSYGLIFGFGEIPAMGIAGAALGTVISTILIVCLYAGLYFNRAYRRIFGTLKNAIIIDSGIVRRYIRLGLPSGVEMFLNMAAFNLFLLFFQSFGVVEGASAAIVFNWDILSFVPLTGLSIAVMSMTGKSLGANDMPAISSLMKTGFMISLGYSGILAIGFFIFRAPMVNIFLTGGPHAAKIYDLSQFMLLGLISYMMADAVIQIAGAVLRGTGDTKWLMFTSISLHWFMLLAQVIMIKVLHRQSHEVWSAFVIMIIATAFIYFLRLRQQRWLKHDARHQVMQEN